MPRRKKRLLPELNPPIGWKGHICFNEKKHGVWLLMNGVKLGKETEGGFYECEMTHEVFKKIDPYWGTFFWQLEPIKASA